MVTRDAIADALKRYQKITRISLESVNRTLTSCDFSGSGPVEMRYDFEDGAIMTVELLPDVAGKGE
jgi:hypothetical protein